jgi:hypothetical protein
MQRLSIAISAVVFLSGVDVIVAQRATAASVNCSYDVCLKECVRRGTTANGCNKWCGDAMTERKNAGQCKK